MESNEKLIQYRLERARETLEEAQLMADSSHWNACVNRLYYACFYAVNALLATQRLSSAKHSGVRALFGRHFVKTGIVSRDLAAFYNDLFEYRQEGDYEDFFEVDPDMVHPWIVQAGTFIQVITELIQQRKSP
jgi:uncharacterized protein (UPF0332 family)